MAETQVSVLEPAFVRNTSMHLDPPPLPELIRAKTEPAKLPTGLAEDTWGAPPGLEDCTVVDNEPNSPWRHLQQPESQVQDYLNWPQDVVHVMPYLYPMGDDAVPATPCDPAPLGGVGCAWTASPLAVGEDDAPKPPELSRAQSEPARPKLSLMTEDPPPQKPQTLVIAQSADTGVEKVCWTVDAKKLKGSDKVAVSPPFELANVPGTFKMMLCPKAVSDRKGGASFKKAKGKGFIQLKCEAALGKTGGGKLTLRVSVGSGSPDGAQEPPRGPVSHDFAECGVCSLPKQQEEWNFSKVVDEATQTFEVCLEHLPQEGMIPPCRGPPGLSS